MVSKRHFPLFIFLVSGVVLLSLWLSSSGHQTDAEPVGDLRPKPQVPSPVVEKKLPSQTTNLLRFGQRTDVPAPSVVWEFQRTDHLISKLRECNLLGEAPRSSEHTSSVLQVSDEHILVFTAHTATPHATMTDHLLMMKCLKHSSIRAKDQVTNQVFTAEKWPHLNDDKTFSLDTFVKLTAKEGSYQTIGLQRFDRPDLHFKNVSNLEPVSYTHLTLPTICSV